MKNAAADPVIAEYSEAAKEYDRKWSFYIEATVRETLSRLPMRADSQLLDVGCGTGEFLSRLAMQYPGAALAGIDPVPAMLEIAQGKLPGQVQLREGYANALPWPDGSFDIVASCNMFHYITHPIPALQEMERVLRPGGTLVITDWCDDYLACKLCNIYLRMTKRSYYKTYREREFRALLQAAGHAEASIDRYKINWLWGMMTAVVTKRSTQ